MADLLVLDFGKFFRLGKDRLLKAEGKEGPVTPVWDAVKLKRKVGKLRF